MGRVMITCPATDRPVYTHLNFNWIEFEEVELEAQELRCPECHGTHVWRKDDAFIEEEGGGN